MPRGYIHTAETLLKKVRKTKNGCWNFTGPIDINSGYGRVGYKGKVTNAHRLAWILSNGPIDSNKIFVCHKCDNRKCINPDHLFLGTAKDNTQDMISKGRRKNKPRRDRCKRGHDITTPESRSKSGGCYACGLITTKARYHRNKIANQS